MAAPKLRLSTTTIGPISIATGHNGPNQTIGAYNAGDGDFNLSFTPSVPWLSAQTGGSQPCSNDYSKTCLAIIVALQTSGLSAGTTTGTLRISDPNSLDAPQDVVVTVQIGGGVPSQLSFFVPPNGSPVKQSIKTSNSFQASATNPGGGLSLTLVTNGGGSFATSYGYDIYVQAPTGTSEGPYGAALNVFGSSIPDDNKQVSISIQVTSQPIAAPVPASLNFKAANGSAPQTLYLNFNNSGMTALGVTGADPGSSAWLTVPQINGNTISVTADPTGLDNGTYTGTLTVASNAANPVVVPVTLVVVDPGSPVSAYQSIASIVGSAPSTDAVALGDIVTVSGELFTVQAAQAADPTQPLPTSLGGATVTVNGIAAPIFSISSNAIQFQVPYEAAAGDSTVEVDRDGNTGNVLSLQIAQAAPKISSVLNQNSATVWAPGGPQATVATGDTLTVYGYGFGPTTPPIPSGTPAPDSFEALDPGILAFFSSGGLFGNNFTVPTQSANLVQGAIGLYQVVVVIPDNVPHGALIPMTIELPGVASSNVVYLNIP